MKEMIIGVDAGGSKTRACAYLPGESAPICESCAGSGNLAADRESACREILSAVTQILTRTDGRCVFLAVGAAGISASSDLLRTGLSSVGGLSFVPMELISDAELALYANFTPSPDAASALVISGTGSAVFAFAGERIIRSGGWGHILGDGGSGYHAALLFLKKLTEYADADPSMLHRVLHLLEDTGCTALTGGEFRQTVVNLVYRQPKSAAASLAPYIARLAGTWEPARDILAESADALVTDVMRLSGQMPSPVKQLAYAGGFLTNCAIFREIFTEKLRQRIPDVTIKPSADPTMGAVRLYCKIREEL